MIAMELACREVCGLMDVRQGTVMEILVLSARLKFRQHCRSHPNAYLMHMQMHAVIKRHYSDSLLSLSCFSLRLGYMHARLEFFFFFFFIFSICFAVILWGTIVRREFPAVPYLHIQQACHILT